MRGVEKTGACRMYKSDIQVIQAKALSYSKELKKNIASADVIRLLLSDIEDFKSQNSKRTKSYKTKSKKDLFVNKKNTSHWIVRAAVSAGMLIVPEACLECGNGGLLHAHHDDYNKPLDVKWLCASCHAKRPKINRLIKKV